jgi:hypothetical protein
MNVEIWTTSLETPGICVHEQIDTWQMPAVVQFPDPVISQRSPQAPSMWRRGAVTHSAGTGRSYNPGLELELELGNRNCYVKGPF